MRLSARQRGVTWLLFCGIFIAQAVALGWLILSPHPTTTADFVIGICVLAVAAYCGAAGIVRLRSPADKDEAPKRLRKFQISLRELILAVFLIAFLAFMFVEMFPSLAGRQGLEFNAGSTSKPYRFRTVNYFYTTQDPLLFAIATDTSAGIRSAQLDPLNPFLLFGPITLEYGQKSMHINYDPSNDTVAIDGTKFDLDKGRFLLFDPDDSQQTLQQRDVKIEKVRIQRHDVNYLLEAIDNSLSAK